MRIVQKLVAILVYAALLLPGNENRLATWARATEVFSTALDRTLRRRKLPPDLTRQPAFDVELRIIQHRLTRRRIGV